MREHIADFYDGAAWASGPGPLYDRLSVEMVRCSPVPLRGARVLDVGAGTGAASRAVAAEGGLPVATDRSLDMLRHQGMRAPAAAADATSLPFRDGAFDASMAAFVLSHLDDPSAGLREMARVTRPAGIVLAIQFAANDHAAKDAVEETARRFGYVRPEWYETVKTRGETALATPDRFVAVARSAGLRDADVTERRVDAGLRSPGDLVRWRLGIPALAAFVRSLDRDARHRFLTAASDAIGPDPEPFLPDVLVLTASVSAPVVRTA